MKSLIDNAAWIWLSQKKQIPNQYVCFRKKFPLKEIKQSGVFEISIDSDFIAYLNGIEIGRGQFSDYPERKTYSRFIIKKELFKNKNILAVLGYFRGENFHDHRAGKPGLAAALEIGSNVIATDRSWKVKLHPAFKSGIMPKVTGQQGFTVLFDARKDIPWREVAYKDSSWLFAAIQKYEKGFRDKITPRPVPSLSRNEPIHPRIVMQGFFIRDSEKSTYAETMSTDALITKRAIEVFSNPEFTDFSKGYTRNPIQASDFVQYKDATGLKINPPNDPRISGCFIIFDMGQGETGNILLSLKSHSGVILDIGHGEHLDDGRVRTYIGGRNFADRYITRDGINEFEIPFRRVGCRYLQIHISNLKKEISVQYVGLIPILYKIETKYKFETSNSINEKIYSIGIKTMHLCMHEHYEDCPWREQALFSYDARNQALFGYYPFGNYDFAETSLELLGRGIRPDGMLELCAPGKTSSTIPIFSFVWITAIREHWLHSGKSRLFDLFEKQICFMLDHALEKFDKTKGLYSLPEGKGIWNFYEWVSGLAFSPNQNFAGEHHAAYNLYLREAIRSLEWMLIQKGQEKEARTYKQKALDLGIAIECNFWDSGKTCYASIIKKGQKEGSHDHIQALMLSENIVPKNKKCVLLQNILTQKLQAMTFSSMLYLLKGLMLVSSASRCFADNTIQKLWLPMVYSGATTFWETPSGGNDFSYAGSLCHAWSSLPVYYYHAYVLGIQPLEPGFKKFLITPYPAGLSWAEGTIATPQGLIHLRWDISSKNIIIKAKGPSCLNPIVIPYPECPDIKAYYNGKSI